MSITKYSRILASVLLLVSANVFSGEPIKLGPQVSYFDYKEPGLMEDTGVLYGIYGEADYVFGTNNRFRLFPSLDLLTGRTKYEGGLWDGTPLTTHGRNTLFQARLPIGYNFINRENRILTGYSGLNYRWLYNKDDGAGAYTRNIKQLYVPLGLAYRMKFSNANEVELRAEYNHLLTGSVKSDFSDVDSSLPDISNTQRDGKGARVQVLWERPCRSVGLFVSASYQFLKVEDSEMEEFDEETLVYEPMNKTHLVGVSGGIAF